MSFLLSVFCALSQAEEVELSKNTLQNGWYLYAIRDYESAGHVSKNLIDKDPSDIEAHRLNLYARSRFDPMVETWEYQLWYEKNKDNSVARIVYAMALSKLDNNYEDTKDLLLLDSEHPDLRYWSLRIQSRKLPNNSEEQKSVEQKIIELGSEYLPAHAYRMRLLFEQPEACTAEWIEEFSDLVELQPWALGSAAGIGVSDFSTNMNTCLSNIQKEAISIAKKQRKSSEPSDVYAAYKVFEKAGLDKMREKTMKHLMKIDPEHVELLQALEEKNSVQKIYDANRQPTHELALKELQKISSELPKNESIRVQYELTVGRRYESMGNMEEAISAKYKATKLKPNDSSLLNEFAYDAVLEGLMLNEALAASSRSIELTRTSQLENSTIGHQRLIEQNNFDLASYLDTRGWIYYQMGEYEKARTDLEESLRYVNDENILKAHLALVLIALETEERLALELLLTAIVDGIYEEELLKTSLKKAEELFLNSDTIWFTGDFDEYLNGMKEVKKSRAEPEIEENEIHPLIGKSIPVDDFILIRGDEEKLSTIQRELLVIDVWATWCAPCVQGMPHLQDVAALYKDKGVRIVGLSVDQKKEEPFRFFKNFEAPAYTVGWIGDGGFELLEIQGIPSMFIVDSEGVVLEYLLGYGQGSTELEDTLDKLLVK